MTKFEARGAKTALAIGTILSTLGLWVGCGDSESTNPVSSSSSTGVGGSSSTAPAGGGGSGGTKATSTTEDGGSGGSGGAPEKCLADAKIADLFEIMDADLCAVARYEAPAPMVSNFGTLGPIDFHYSAISWGSHGGPLSNAVNATTASSVDLLRYAAHDQTIDVVTKTAATMLPDMTYLGGAALDLGFFGWTAIDYSGAPGEGEVILVKGTDVAKRYHANSPFAFGAIVESSDKGRLIYTGLSKLDDEMTSENALYAADSCGTSVSDPALEGCGDPIQVHKWGQGSGPVAVDALGNAFAIGVNFGTDQEARGFGKKEIGRGAAPTEGTSMFTVDGFGSALAAIAPTAMKEGILAFQPEAGMGAAADTLGQHYKLDGDKVTPVAATPTTLFHFANADTATAMVTDPDAKLWVALTVTTGNDTKLVFVVIDRKP